MQTGRRALGFSLLTAAAVATLTLPLGGQSGSASQAPTQEVLARGEYLANSVAMCVQCHSGRDRHGNILDTERFKGAAMPVRSPYPATEFALRAPNIAGLPGFTDEQVVALLTTGVATDRRRPLPPMPPFRMERQDAEAIVAYLRTR